MDDNLPPSSANVTDYGSLNLPERSGPHRPVMGLLKYSVLMMACLGRRCLTKYIFYLILILYLNTTGCLLQLKLSVTVCIWDLHCVHQHAHADVSEAASGVTHPKTQHLNLEDSNWHVTYCYIAECYMLQITWRHAMLHRVRRASDIVHNFCSNPNMEVGRIDLDQNGDRWCAVVCAVMNLRVPYKGVNI
jgi:hypothetical protein